jgi:hypothetical protein
MERIDIEIDTKGNVKIGVEGVAGSDCAKLTEAIEEALGDVESKRRTAEYNKPPQFVRKVGA